MHTQVYLFFDGRTEEALDFYKKTLGVEVEMMMRFKDDPEKDKHPESCPPGAEDKVMHSCFKLGDQRVMASDGYAKGNPEFKGFSLSLAVKDETEADKVFAALSQGRARSRCRWQDLLLAEIRYGRRTSSAWAGC